MTISGSSTTEVHYINCGSGLVAMFVKDNANPNGKMYYPYSDYLGSILVVTDDQGNPVAEQSFDAWGRNRNPIDWTYTNIPSVPSWLYRGYTGHEHLPEFSLINMNGRMYDPVVGRMLNPDINLQNPDYSQNHNRYSYALNNPLKFTDPSGNAYDWMGGSSWSDYSTATEDATSFNMDMESIFNSEFNNNHFLGAGQMMGYGASSEVIDMRQMGAEAMALYDKNHPVELARFTTSKLKKYPSWTHSDIIHAVFNNILPSKYVDLLIRGSENADRSKYQGPEYSYMHAMRASSLVTLAKAQEDTRNFINKQVAKFKWDVSQGAYEDAYFQLGMAMHPLMDMWSPSHKGFQVWDVIWTPDASGNGIVLNGVSLAKVLVHFFREASTSEGLYEAASSIAELYNRLSKDPNLILPKK